MVRCGHTFCFCESITQLSVRAICGVTLVPSLAGSSGMGVVCLTGINRGTRIQVRRINLHTLVSGVAMATALIPANSSITSYLLSKQWGLTIHLCFGLEWVVWSPGGNTFGTSYSWTGKLKILTGIDQGCLQAAVPGQLQTWAIWQCHNGIAYLYIELGPLHGFLNRQV